MEFEGEEAHIFIHYDTWWHVLFIIMYALSIHCTTGSGTGQVITNSRQKVPNYPVAPTVGVALHKCRIYSIAL